MGRIADRLLVLTAVLGLTGCGSAPAPPTPPPSPPVIVPSDSATPSDIPSEIFEEEDVEPSDAPGDLSQEAQAYLDEALGTELAALAEKGEQRPALEKLPEEPSQVVAALKDYQWLSPQAKALYDKAVTS